MGKLLLILLCFIPLRAFASSADSGICPWKLPFTLQARAAGELHVSGGFIPEEGPGTELNNDLVTDTENLSFVVDSTYTLQNDTLRIKRDSDNESLMVVFAHGVDSIKSIAWTKYLSGEDVSFWVSSLRFDSSGIYVSDSSMSGHQASITIQWYCTNYIGRHDYVSVTNSFIASSASLSGIFRNIYLKKPASQDNSLRVPFDFLIRGSGTLDSGGMHQLDTASVFLKVWCSAPPSSDTFYFRSGIEDCSGNANDTSVEIDLIPSTDSINTVKIMVASTSIFAGPFLQDQWEVFRTQTLFTIDNLVYASTSIFSTDSSFCSHRISMRVYKTDEDYYNSELTYDTLQTFTATSATLSGIFRPTHYTCDESVSEPPRENATLRVFSLNNSLECSFVASNEPRTAEVYSVLGTEIAHSQIPAGTTAATIANLPPGFYFVRLGGATARAVVRE